MKKLLITILCWSISLNAGDSRYDWADFGGFGLGEINNQLLIYCGDDICITPIPGFETYWKWYLLWSIASIFIILFIRKKN